MTHEGKKAVKELIKYIEDLPIDTLWSEGNNNGSYMNVSIPESESLQLSRISAAKSGKGGVKATSAKGTDKPKTASAKEGSQKAASQNGGD